MAGVTRSVVVLAQEQEAETGYSHKHQSEPKSSRDVASNDNFGNITHVSAQALTQEDNGTAEVRHSKFYFDIKTDAEHRILTFEILF